MGEFYCIFKNILSDVERKRKRLNQHLPEFLAYLEYAAAYFDFNNIANPLVVEIGILDGAQEQFYKRLLFAEYISIDIDKNAPATIHGDSGDTKIFEKLMALLSGRKIDLLFIDGLHTYAGVKRDYELYSPLVSHLIGIHDVLTYKLNEKDSVDVKRWWQEMLDSNKEDTLFTIQHYNPRPPEAFNGRPLGIGIIVKGRI